MTEGYGGSYLTAISISVKLPIKHNNNWKDKIWLQ